MKVEEMKKLVIGLLLASTLGACSESGNIYDSKKPEDKFSAENTVGLLILGVAAAYAGSHGGGGGGGHNNGCFPVTSTFNNKFINGSLHYGYKDFSGNYWWSRDAHATTLCS